MSKINGPRLAVVGAEAVVELAVLPALRRIGWRPSVVIDSTFGQIEWTASRSYSMADRAKRSADWRSVVGEFDAAVVALATPLENIGAARQMLAAGKHVLLEKPLPTSDGLRLASAAANENNLALSFSLTRRYLPVARWTKALLESETLGNITHIEIREGSVPAFDRQFGLRLQTDIANASLLSASVDTLDLMLWWFGQVESIGYQDDNEGGTAAEGTLDCQLPSGADLHMELSRARRLPNSARIEGSRGFVEVHLYKNEVLSGSPNALSFNCEGVIARSMKPSFNLELFESELSAFKNRILADYKGEGNGQHCIKISDLIEQCYRVRRPLVYPWTKVASEPNSVGAKRSNLPRASRVLVTGASGFVGGRLVERLLEHGGHIRCAIRDNSRDIRLRRFPVELVHVDLEDAAKINSVVKDIDYVFHCAYDARSRRQNIVGLQNLIAACSAHSVRRLVQVSTFAVYEPFVDGALTEETRAGDRSNVYVDVKLTLEKMIFDAVKERKLAATIVQPAIVYGPFSSPWTDFPAEMLLSGEVVLPGHGEGLCNAVYIDDLIDGMILAAIVPDAVGERFIISGPEVVTWATFFTSIAEILGTKAPSFWPHEKISQNISMTGVGSRKAKLTPKRLLKEFVRGARLRPILHNWFERLPIQLQKSILNKFEARQHLKYNSYIPDQRLLAFYSSKPVATSDKAKSKLGYLPLIDFRKGMSLTGHYLRWAYRQPSSRS